MNQRNLANSTAAFDRATRTHAAGVSSSTRGRKVGWYPEPPVIDRAEGAYLYDIDGNQYIDYLLAHGPLILGHKPPVVTEAVTRALQERGALFALPYDLEYHVSEKLVQHIPSIEKVKFSNSGSEACHYAIRLARAVTGKDKILKFEGQYHGWTDVAHFSYHPVLDQAGPVEAPHTVADCPGIPPAYNQAVVVAPWNDIDILEKIVAKHHKELAAIITEPVMANSGVIMPQPGYLEFLREITLNYSLLLIFDEVITGFRSGIGGAQADLGVTPDITILAKGLGAGFPISAYGGSDEVMQGLVEERFMHGGTYNSNVVAMAAAEATLRELEKPDTYGHLLQRTTMLAEGTRQIFMDAGVPIVVQQYGAMFSPFFSEHGLHNYRAVVQHASGKAYQAYHRALIDRGVVMYPNHMGRWFVSIAHTEAAVQNTLDRIADSIFEVKEAL